MKAKILTDFQICISVPLNIILSNTQIQESLVRTLILSKTLNPEAVARRCSEKRYIHKSTSKYKNTIYNSIINFL